MTTDDILHALREQRLTTLALADQIKDDRWREPLLPGERSLHDLLAHILGWDEWAVGVFEISRLRALPPVLIDALRDVDAYNARAMRRYAGITRDDMLSALQASPDRVFASAVGPGGEQLAGSALPGAGAMRVRWTRRRTNRSSHRAGRASAGCCVCCCATRSATTRKSARPSSITPRPGALSRE